MAQYYALIKRIMTETVVILVSGLHFALVVCFFLTYRVSYKTNFNFMRLPNFINDKIKTQRG